jgi:hypothetical protein
MSSDNPVLGMIDPWSDTITGLNSSADESGGIAITVRTVVAQVVIHRERS